MTELPSTPSLGARWLTIFVGLASALLFTVPAVGLALGAGLYIGLAVAYARLAPRRRLQNYVAQLQGGLGTGAGIIALALLDRRGHGALGLTALTAICLVALLVHADLLRRYGPAQRAPLHEEPNQREH